MAAPRVFVSHSHADAAWCDPFADTLARAGLDVWYDRQGLYVGVQWVQAIERELQGRDHFLIVLTPDAWASPWVQEELALALGLHKTIVGVIHKPTPVSGFLTNRQLLDLTGQDATAAAGRVLAAIGAPATAAHAPPVASSPPVAPPPPEAPAIPPARFPPRLAQLGYAGRVLGGVEVIVPPLCDVPAGEFLMGSDPAQDKQTGAGEQPQRWVTVAGFQIARHPVTVAEYACYVRAEGKEPQRRVYEKKVVDWQRQQGRPDHPLVCVTWHDAVAYAAWLARVTGQPWRLPTEAEWEKAARWDPSARHSRVYPWGDTFDQSRCNTAGAGKGTTTPVGCYPNGTSPCGAQDLAGNVWEWTSSLYKPYPYQAGDGGERTDSTENRALRGGSWSDVPEGVRSACRDHDQPGYFDSDIGVRVAMAAGPSA